MDLSFRRLFQTFPTSESQSTKGVVVPHRQGVAVGLRMPMTPRGSLVEGLLSFDWRTDWRTIRRELLTESAC